MASILTVESINQAKSATSNSSNGGEDAVWPVNKVHRSLSTVQTPYEIQAKYSTSWTKATPFLSYKTSDFVYDLKTCSSDRLENGFKHQLLQQWDAAKEKKAFNYKLNCLYKLLDGDYNLSLQLNVERGTLRRKPMRFTNIKQPFNHLRWNFTKLKQNEMLFLLRCLDKPYTADKLDIHAMAVNASPLEKGHSLIIPSMNKCLPQILNSTAVRMAVDLMLLVEDETFHLLFNSLLGQASVNHLHIHSLFWPYESDIVNRRVELLSTSASKMDSPSRAIYLIRRPDWFIQTLVFQLQCPADFEQFICNLTNCANFLTEENIAHNLIISRAPKLRPSSVGMRTEEENFTENNGEDGGSLYVTAYLFPRRNQSGAKPPTSFSPASLELAGLLTAYTYRFFEAATEQSAIRVIDEDAVLSDDVFDMLVEELADRFEGRTPWAFSSEDEAQKAHLLAPTSTVRSASLIDRRRWSQLSKSVSEKLGDSRNATALTSCELDELADAFHTITSPIPLRQQHSVGSNNSSCSGSPICMSALAQNAQRSPVDSSPRKGDTIGNKSSLVEQKRSSSLDETDTG